LQARWRFSGHRQTFVDKKNIPKAEAYLLVRDGSIHTGSPPSNDFYVRGAVSSSNVFRPIGNVEGVGELADRGIPGWLELSRGTFVRRQADMSPYHPFLRGFLDPNLTFRPETRIIDY
jgi:hypothetical protein